MLYIMFSFWSIFFSLIFVAVIIFTFIGFISVYSSDIVIVSHWQWLNFWQNDFHLSLAKIISSAISSLHKYILYLYPNFIYIVMCRHSPCPPWEDVCRDSLPESSGYLCNYKGFCWLTICICRIGLYILTYFHWYAWLGYQVPHILKTGVCAQMTSFLLHFWPHIEGNEYIFCPSRISSSCAVNSSL